MKVNQIWLGMHGVMVFVGVLVEKAKIMTVNQTWLGMHGVMVLW